MIVERIINWLRKPATAAEPSGTTDAVDDGDRPSNISYFAAAVTGPDIDPEDYDFNRHSGEASTAKFLKWHWDTYPDQIGLRRAQLWTRYQLYCCVSGVRPLPAGRWIQTLQGHGVTPRRIRDHTGRRPTIYDIQARAQRSKSAAA